MHDSATAAVTGTEISLNFASSEGAAASLTAAASLAITGATLEANKAASGGCFWIEMRTALNLTQCTFTDNTATFVVRPSPFPLRHTYAGGPSCVAGMDL